MLCPVIIHVCFLRRKFQHRQFWGELNYLFTGVLLMTVLSRQAEKDPTHPEAGLPSFCMILKGALPDPK